MAKKPRKMAPAADRLAVITDRELKERRFAIEYCRLFDAKKAAEALGLEGQQATRFGNQALKQPHVRQIILTTLDDMAARLGVTEDRTIREIARIGFANVADLIVNGPDGPELCLDGIDSEIGAAIAGIDKIVVERTDGDGNITKTVTHKLRMADKRAALADLAKILALFAGDRASQQSADALSALLQQINAAGGSAVRPAKG